MSSKEGVKNSLMSTKEAAEGSSTSDKEDIEREFMRAQCSVLALQKLSDDLGWERLRAERLIEQLNETLGLIDTREKRAKVYLRDEEETAAGEMAELTKATKGERALSVDELKELRTFLVGTSQLISTGLTHKGIDPEDVDFARVLTGFQEDDNPLCRCVNCLMWTRSPTQLCSSCTPKSTVI